MQQFKNIKIVNSYFQDISDFGELLFQLINHYLSRNDKPKCEQNHNRKRKFSETYNSMDTQFLTSKSKAFEELEASITTCFDTLISMKFTDENMTQFLSSELTKMLGNNNTFMKISESSRKSLALLYVERYRYFQMHIAVFNMI